MKSIMVIQHVPHENLGTMEDIFLKQNIAVNYFGPQNLHTFIVEGFSADALIVMGGPMNVYDTDEFPHLEKTVLLIRHVAALKKPILGICLGGQLIAKAFGAKVTKNPQKEIGWYPLQLSAGAADDLLFKKFNTEEKVFQWHGDTFALPEGAVHLASSPLCINQAYRLGSNIYGLQFHLEVTANMIAQWIDESGNALELKALAGIIDSGQIKSDTKANISRLNDLSLHFSQAFLSLGV